MTDQPPQSLPCPECGSHYHRSVMPDHLRWQHGYDPEAAVYQTGRIYNHAWREYEKSLLNRAKGGVIQP